MAQEAAAFTSGCLTFEARQTVGSTIKPEELLGLEATSLAFTYRGTLTQLLDCAWDEIDRPVTHVILKSALYGCHNSNDRVGETNDRSMAAIGESLVSDVGACQRTDV